MQVKVRTAYLRAGSSGTDLWTGETKQRLWRFPVSPKGHANLLAWANLSRSAISESEGDGPERDGSYGSSTVHRSTSGQPHGPPSGSRMTSIGRRTLITGAVAGAGAIALGKSPGLGGSTGLVQTRLTLPSGAQTGDVTTNSAVLWSRASGPGRLIARLVSGTRVEELRGGWATESSDFTAKLALSGLAPGREYTVAIQFESEDGLRGEVGHCRFSTATIQPARTSFVWTADTCGQGWGINEDIGGLRGYEAMHATNPDFFIHSGDTIYGDSPIPARITEPDGRIWRNLVTPEVSKVAESLNEFRGRHRYNLLDGNLRAMYANVPVIAQWDDHETTNNWYPGEILDDPRYTERRVDVLAARSRRAWQEYMPIADPRATQPGDGFASARIYRKVSRGPLLDVFCLDMRTFKDPNTPNRERDRTDLLGREQVEWLVREVSASRATWKVISADLPLGLVVPDGRRNQESLSNGHPGKPRGRELELAEVLSRFKRNRVRNTLWITADVHYCAAHHYAPSRAAFTDFDPFWEIGAGPIAAGTFGPSPLDSTFGPRVVFRKTGDYPNQSPRHGNQFFGHVTIAADGLLTVSLRDIVGRTLWRKDLEPA
jgi:alkaline phosphatase D